MRSPQRGEVWLVDLGLAAKVRPCLVISVPASLSDRALATLVPHTTALRGSPYEIAVQVRAFDAQGLVTVPHAKLLRAPGRLGDDQLAVIERGVRTWLGLT